MKKILIPFFIMVVLSLTFIPAMAEDSPSKAYDRYHQVLMEQDWDTLITLVTENRRKEAESFTDEKKKMLLTAIKEYAPKSYEIVREKLNGDTAELYIEGMTRSFNSDQLEKSYAKVVFKKENGAWKLEKESWSSEYKCEGK